MIDLSICKRGPEFSVTAQGHAHYAASGQDIVCAAVSTMLFDLCAYVKMLDKHGLTKKAPVTMFGKGRCQIKLVPELQEREKTEYIFSQFAEALRQLEIDYPENIRLTVKER